MFISTRIGIVSAIAFPPRAAAFSHAASCARYRSGSLASTVSTFQLRGRRAASVISAICSTSSSRKPRMQPSVTYSSVVPSCSRIAPHSARTSSFDAHRDATGCPSPSECVNASVVEKPIPPASTDSCSSRTIWSIWSSVASLPTASGPITLRRRAQWPTLNIAFTATFPSSRSR